MRHRHVYISGGLFLVAIILSACAPKISGLRVDPSFTYPSILDGNMVVVGVTSIVHGLSDPQQNIYANMLRTALIEERERFNVLPPGSVIGLFGQAAHKQLMEEYKITGVVSGERLKELKAKIQSVKYVVFARIENDTTANTRIEDDENEKIITRATRSISARLDIYDISSEISAWSGSLRLTRSNENEYEKPSGLAQLVQAVAGEPQSDAERFPFPDPPTTEQVLEVVFRGFAVNMPEED